MCAVYAQCLLFIKSPIFRVTMDETDAEFVNSNDDTEDDKNDTKAVSSVDYSGNKKLWTRQSLVPMKCRSIMSPLVYQSVKMQDVRRCEYAICPATFWISLMMPTVHNLK